MLQPEPIVSVTALQWPLHHKGRPEYRTPRRSLLLGSTQGLVAGLQAQLRGVGLADEQIAVELHLGGIAELPAGTTLAATATAGTKVQPSGRSVPSFLLLT